ncbi:nucleoside diphosphate kinase 3 isoform X1 [Panthera tigris]|uniref:nucleoside diphosphate kinase 3 isoform X1 n=1 Tax=Panthera leo TaxID=9689 RepID=UPI001C698FA4|nr:nucleoside diphosphate kinase 3 isoform X1 [Panthera leo]XP_042826886.1 nucleoside diphosphate kinase 3 isoform X1 [Panthera tigris]XP_049493220.1 nucleoside diphosphate kinase 3 isoform X1 [Panthera uncia]
MICLVLTVLAHLFPAACAGVHERTFLAVKPDGVQRRLVGEIVRRFERKGFKLVALKLVQASEELLREHYAELRERPFYGRLVDYMGSGPVVAMVWQGLDVVRASRALIGATDPADALPGTIRGDFCVEERDPRQRLGGERPPRDRPLVPRRGAAVLGGQRRALAVRVALPAGPRGRPVCDPPGNALGPALRLAGTSVYNKVKCLCSRRSGPRDTELRVKTFITYRADTWVCLQGQSLRRMSAQPLPPAAPTQLAPESLHGLWEQTRD